MELDGPPVAVAAAVRPELVEDRPQVPVGEAVSQEQEVAVAQPLEDLDRDQIVEIHPGEVLAVVILGDHVAVVVVVGGIAAIDEAVELEHHGPPIRVDVDVRLGIGDGLQAAVGRLVAEPALVGAFGGVDHEVVRLARRGVGGLHEIVVVRRHDQRRPPHASQPAQPRRHRGEEVVRRRRRELLVEDVVQDVVERPGPASHRVDVLGHLQQVQRRRSGGYLKCLARYAASSRPLGGRRPSHCWGPASSLPATFTPAPRTGVTRPRRIPAATLSKCSSSAGSLPPAASAISPRPAVSPADRTSAGSRPARSRHQAVAT